MYYIILTNWYQEIPDDGKQLEIYNNKSFIKIDDAINYLCKNKKTILDFYPVIEISIKFLTDDEFKKFYK